MSLSEIDPAATQAINWMGLIPIQLTLAPTSVSSPTLPPPIHVLVPRHTFLHAGLFHAVQRLQPFAPCSPFLTGRAMLQISEPDPGGDLDEDVDSTKSKAVEAAVHVSGQTSLVTDATFIYPVCWFEDEETKMAVRWHLFAGILFDLKPEKTLPWKLKLHLNNYPSSQILPLEHPVLSSVQASFKHSLKQAMTVASSNSRTAMNVTKESHGMLWEAVTTANYPLYQRVDLVSTAANSPAAIPVRVLVNANPPVQRRVDGAISTTTSLGWLLQEWLPEHFFASTSSSSNTDSITTDESQKRTGATPGPTVKCWRVSGIEPSLTTSILDLWKHCAQPDHFLYIVVLTTTR